LENKGADEMRLKEYQEKSMRTLNKNVKGEDRTLNMLLGINGEVGEVTDLFKKHFFQGHKLDMKKVSEEIGDVMFYIVNLCNLYDLELEEVIEENYNKLLKRYPVGFDESKSVKRNKEVEQAYLKKHEENYRRQREGY
jgi:NTP pyrophosphatase (non-canonical NTP hydrolase)